MKIYYDSCIFSLQKIGGISIVFSEIVKGLKEWKKFELHILLNGNSISNLVFKAFLNDFHIHREIRLFKMILPFMPILKKLPRGIIYHTTYTRYSFQKDIKKVITIHDLGYEHGIMRKGLKRNVHLFFKRIAIKNANAVICVSKNTYNDLYYYYNDLLKDKVVRVIYNGLSEDFFKDDDEFRKDTKKYILYVGGRQAYKNFEMVVKAVSRLEGFDLIVAGGGNLSPKHQLLLSTYLKARHILKLNLSTSDLKKLYSQAYCLVYPSSYEGFGLPLLEAMASGCPVIACDNSCISEITNDSALLIPEPNVLKITEAISKLSNQSLRNRLVDLGKLNARRFSWDNTVKETINLYECLIDKKI